MPNLINLTKTLDVLGCQYALYCRIGGETPFFQSNQDRFSSASIIKVPILLAWLALERQGEVVRSELCDLDAEPQVQGSGFSWLLRARRLPFQDILLMMIATSDNLCTNLVIRRAGLARLNEVIHDHLGLTGTALQRKLFDYEARARGLDNWVSAADCIRLYALVEALPQVEREWVESLLSACVDEALLKRCIPRDTVNFYHKTGSMTGVLHDWGYTDRCQIFLLTQNVQEEPPLFEIFGEAGKCML